MSLDVVHTSLPSRQYLKLGEPELQSLRKERCIHLLSTNIDGADLCIVLMLAPLGEAWGMQYSHPLDLHEQMEGRLVDDLVAACMKQALDQAGISPDLVPPMLAGAEAFGSERQLMLGQQIADLPRAFFRPVHVANNEAAMDLFLRRLQEHVEELGGFFLLPVPARADSKTWCESVDYRLDELFNTRVSTSRTDHTQAHIQALTNALQELDAQTVSMWLTPFFLDWEPVRPNYPLPVSKAKSKRTPSILKMFDLRPVEDVEADKRAVTMLLLAMIRKWEWPLGIRRLHRLQTATEVRQLALAKSEPVADVELAVSELLVAAKDRYPVLFS